MALRTKLNTGEEGETNDVSNDLNMKKMEGINDLDVAYVNNLKNNGINDDLLSQFMDITKQLEDLNNDKK